jgi:hypothetical protein
MLTIVNYLTVSGKYDMGQSLPSSPFKTVCVQYGNVHSALVQYVQYLQSILLSF